MSKQAREQSIVRLKEWLKEDDELLLVLRHRSKSGLTRYYDVFHLESTRDFRYLNYHVGRALGYSRAEKANGLHRDSLIVRGYGFNAEDEITTTLSYVLFGDPKRLGSRAL